MNKRDESFSMRVFSSTKELIEKNKGDMTYSIFIDTAVKHYINSKTKGDNIQLMDELVKQQKKTDDMVLVLLGMVGRLLDKSLSLKDREEVEKMLKK